MAPTSALASAEAMTAAVVARDGIQIASPGGLGGYTRITASARMWTEVGESVPDQPVYDTVLPFAPRARGVSLTIIGGRTFEKTVPVTDADGLPVDITTARFISQIRSRSGLVLASFTPIVLDGPAGSLKLVLTAYETQVAAGMATSGVWDVEMHLNGQELTVVPVGKVTLVMGVSQGITATVHEVVAGVCEAFPATVVVL